MKSFTQLWKNLSISKKLYLVIGVMALLIVSELFVLRFAMKTLSAARALVGGESLWSKAQKDAVFSLQRYQTGKNEKDYEEFLDFLKITEGDHAARIELQNPNPNYEIIRAGFTQGHIHADDIKPVVELLHRFYWISYLARAIQTWADADTLIIQLKKNAVQLHQNLLTHHFQDAENSMEEIKSLNNQLTGVEVEFSEALGAGSRWLITHQIIEAHQGTIGVESEENKRTCFTIRLKLA